MPCPSCSRAPCSCVPTPSAPGCNPSGRGPGVAPLPGNAPVDLAALQCTPALAVQPAIDQARRQIHLAGLRPYRVRLVWQVQDEDTRQWVEDANLELMPVEVLDFESVDLIVEAAGQKPDGVIRLREVSPNQVDEWTLRGYRNGEPWGDDSDRREFFYEVQLLSLCAGDPTPRTYRFILAGAPVLRMDRNEWQVRLTTQFGHRTPERVDQTVVDEDEVFEGAVLVG